MSFSLLRLLRLLALALLLFGLFSAVTFTCNQSRLQTFLKSQYITWDDFPLSYAEKLRSKDWDSLQTGVFDYNHVFPSPTTAADSIPPIIHFIWFPNLYKTRPEVTQMPSLGSDAPRLCAEHNPTYDIKIWNATASRHLLEENYSWFLPTYDAYIYPIQRIDAIKYFVLWHYGGVYIDMDIACRRPLDPLLDFPAWFPEASPLGVNNDLMASKARHPVILLMLENLGRRNKNLIFPYLTIFWSTGPQFTSDMLKQWFLLHEDGNNHRYVRGTSKIEPDSASWFILPQVFYSEEYTFFGHSPGGTWHGDDVSTILWLVAHPLVFWALVVLAFGGCSLLPLLHRRRRRRLQSERRLKDVEF